MQNKSALKSNTKANTSVLNENDGISDKNLIKVTSNQQKMSTIS